MLRAPPGRFSRRRLLATRAVTHRPRSSSGRRVVGGRSCWTPRLSETPGMRHRTSPMDRGASDSPQLPALRHASCTHIRRPSPLRSLFNIIVPPIPSYFPSTTCSQPVSFFSQTCFSAALPVRTSRTRQRQPSHHNNYSSCEPRVTIPAIVPIRQNNPYVRSQGLPLPTYPRRTHSACSSSSTSYLSVRMLGHAVRTSPVLLGDSPPDDSVLE